MSWCFAMVNGRLAEVFFEKKRKSVSFLGHAYADKGDYKTREKNRWIEKDTNKFKLAYQKGIYKDLTTGKIYQSVKRFSG